jgi:hypothetical protein
MAANRELVRYLLQNPGYHILQHGCHHDYLEFERASQDEIVHRIELGTRALQEAGLPKPQTFVAPYDKLSRPAFREVARRFRILSTGWFELRHLPYTWWPKYVLKKACNAAHWQIGRTLLLSHPGCLLSCHRVYSTVLGSIVHQLETQLLTVLVTHWWEYFRDGVPDEALIGLLHETAAYLANAADIKTISFADLTSGRVSLN